MAGTVSQFNTFLVAALPDGSRFTEVSLSRKDSDEAEGFSCRIQVITRKTCMGKTSILLGEVFVCLGFFVFDAAGYRQNRPVSRATQGTELSCCLDFFSC